MTDTEYIIPTEQAQEAFDALRALQAKREELYYEEMAFYEGHMLDLESELLHGDPVPWPCMDCGEYIPITKLETLRLVVKGGGWYGHGDC